MSNLLNDFHAERRVAPVPGNHFNTNDPLFLQMLEDADGSARAWAVMVGRVYLPGKFDVAHLRDIHAHVMQDIHPGVGATRGDELLLARYALQHHGTPLPPEYDTRLSLEGQYFALLNADKVNARVEELSSCLAKEGSLRGMDKSLFITRLAEYYVRYSYAAPFQRGTALVLDVMLHNIGELAGYRVESLAAKHLREVTDAILLAGVTSDKTDLIQVLRSVTTENEGPGPAALRSPVLWERAQTLPS